MAMIFRHGFFHGDPHPANILVLEEAGTIGLVDFGAVGKLSDDDMSKLTRMFIDAAQENVDSPAEAPRRSRRPLSRRSARRSSGRAARDVLPLLRRELSEIDPIQVIREAFQLIYSMNLHLPTRYLLLDRAIATLGSVGMELYPDFNVFEVARPYARGLLLERFTPQRVAKRARRDALAYAQVFARGAVPVARLHGADARRADRGRLRAQGARRLHGADAARLQPARVALIVIGGLIGSSLIGIFATSGPHVLGVTSSRCIGFIALGRARDVALLGRRPLRAAVAEQCRAPAGGSHVSMTMPSSRRARRRRTSRARPRCRRR